MFSQNNDCFRDIYYYQLRKFYDSQTGGFKKPWTSDRVFEVINHVKNAKLSIESGDRRTPAEYYWSKKYEVISIGEVDYLVLKKDSPESPTVHVIPLEEYYDILLDVHRNCGHGGRDKIQNQLKDKFIIVRKAIDIFVSLCPTCESKRSLMPKKDIVTKPIISADLNKNLSFKDIYDEQLRKFYSSQSEAVKKPWTKDKVFEVIRHVKHAKVSMESGIRKTSAEYYWSKKYDVISIEDVDCLILKKDSSESPTVRVIPLEEYFDILFDIHKDCGHGGRDKIMNKIRDKFSIARKAIDLLVSLCPTCESKRNSQRKDVVTQPIICHSNERGQIDLIDLQSAPDGEFKWLLNYQDHRTKFTHLRPLCSKNVSDIATELLKIFLEFGAPSTLQSDDRNFTANIIEEMIRMWPECKIILGTPQYLQTQGSFESSNQDVENMLRVWMRDNSSNKWSMGCFFVQYNKNKSFHTIIGMSPFRALYGGQ